MPSQLSGIIDPPALDGICPKLVCYAVQALARSCRVYSFDLRFHGDSGRPTYVSHQTVADTRICACGLMCRTGSNGYEGSALTPGSMLRRATMWRALLQTSVTFWSHMTSRCAIVRVVCSFSNHEECIDRPRSCK